MRRENRDNDQKELSGKTQVLDSLISKVKDVEIFGAKFPPFFSGLHMKHPKITEISIESIKRLDFDVPDLDM